jgi:hypothetical protein
LNKIFCIREDIFPAKTPEDQNKYFIKFLNLNVSLPTPSSVYVASTDGTYSVINKAAGVGKKPGQRKRQSMQRHPKDTTVEFVYSEQAYNEIRLIAK